MKGIWNRISLLGIGEDNNNLISRSIVLKNQINFIMMLVVLFFISYSTILRELDGGKMTMGSLRLNFIFATNLIIIALSFYKFHLLSKYFLIYLPAFFLVPFPYICNFFENESLFFNPIIIIGLSVVVPLILIPGKNNLAIIFSMLYFVILLIINIPIIRAFAPENLEVMAIMNSFDANFAFVPLAAFVFIHLAIYYLRAINKSYEQKLLDNNAKLQKTLNDLKYTQQQLIQSEKMASVGNLTSGVAHEINNPLNFISGGLNILNNNLSNLNIESDIQKEKINRSVQLITEGYKKVSEIVNSLMTFSFRGISSKTPTDINDLIDKTILFIKVKLNDEILIQRNYKLNVPVPVYKEKLHQVILNVLDNAIFVLNNDISNHEKTIEITTELSGTHAQITIFNNGPKISEEIINNIFDPFYTTKDPGKGVGLGLSISYSLIDEHEGFLFAQNSSNGVHFIIKLPID